MSLMLWTSIVLVILVGLTYYLGVISSRRVTSNDQYATGRRQYGPFVLGMTLAGTFASGTTFLGLGGLSFGHGWANMWYIMLYPTGGFIAIAFFVRMLKNMNKIGARTIPEYLGARYDSGGVRIIAGFISILLLFYVATQLVAAGTLIEVLTGLPYVWGVVLTAIFLVAYLWRGGAHADAYTDTMQGTFMAIMGLILIIAFLTGLGTDSGPSGINEAMAERNTNHGWNVFLNPESVGLYDSWFVILMIFVAHIPFVVQPQMGSKLLLLKNSNMLPKALIIGCTATLLMAFGGGLAGFFGSVIDSDIPRADMVNLIAVQELFPTAFTAIFFAVVLMAIMSTADGLFLSVGLVFSNDFFRKTIVPARKLDKKTEEKWVDILTKAGIIFAAIGGITLAVNPPEYITIFVWLGIGGIMAGVGAPIILGMYWKGATKVGAIVTMIVGELGYIFFLGVLGWQPYSASGTMFLICLLVMFLVSLITPKLSDDHLKHFGFNKIRNQK